MIKLRDYQNNGVAGIRSLFAAAWKAVLFVLPTGGGKTVLFTYITQKMSLTGKRVVILVHRIELLQQSSGSLTFFEVEHGMVNPNFTPNFHTNVQVASVQTIVNRLTYFAATNWIPDLIIVDEAHHATAGTWRKTIEHFEALNPNLRVLGVTATPIRTDGQGLGREHGGIFDEILAGPSMKWLMEEGYLVRPKVLSPPKKFEAPTKRGKGDYKRDDLDNLINKPTITGDAVDHYEQTCPGVPTIVFCVSIAHTEEVAAEFRARGYRFYAIDGTTDDETRRRVLQGLADGSVDGVCSCDLISEGTDVPAATCAVLLRLTSSLGLYLQQVGRVLRPVYAPGYDLGTREGRLAAIAASSKPFAYILDHVGNVGNWVDGEFLENHGLPDKEHDWSLAGEVKKRRGKKEVIEQVKTQQCQSCFTVHEPAPVCPSCGHVYEVKDNSPKKVDGVLLEVTEGATIVNKKKPKKTAGQVEVHKAQTLDDLLKIAEQRGYKASWAEHVFNGKAKKFQRLTPPEAGIRIEFPADVPVPANGFDDVLEF